MIIYPRQWMTIGRKVQYKEIYSRLCEVIREIKVSNLSFSGGIDSSLLLSCMHEILDNPIHCYTIALNNSHPDYIYSHQMCNRVGAIHHTYFTDQKYSPDDNVKIFYQWLIGLGVTDIIAGDGVDEFNCGYYDHQNADNIEQVYYDYIWKLFEEQLKPLNDNSEKVKVYLPYLDSKLLTLFSQIPIYEKISATERKKVIRSLALERNIPIEIIDRWKYGFCSATEIKKGNIC